MVRELGDLIPRRGAPGMIVSDNGTELTSHAVLARCGEVGIEWYHRAGQADARRGFVESFNGCMRDELLNETLFFTVGQARAITCPGHSVSLIARCHGITANQLFAWRLVSSSLWPFRCLQQQ